MRRNGGRARRWRPGALGLAAAAVLTFTGCGSSGSDGAAPTTTSATDGADTTSAPSTSDRTTTGSKQSVPIEKAVTLAAATGPAATPIAFTATFRPTLTGTYGFRSDADDPITIDVASSPHLDLERITTVTGTVRATGPGTGSARLTATITAGGSTEATTITLFVASSDGRTAVGTASTSATQQALLDDLLARHVIDEAEYQRRLDHLTGGT